MNYARLPELQAAKAFFKKSYGYPAARYGRSPGRVELLGGMAWALQGLSIYAATNCGVAVALSPRLDGRIRMVSDRFSGEEAFWLTAVDSPAENQWAIPARAMLAGMRSFGLHFSGFEAAVASSIPLDEGLGQSSGLQIALALAVRELFPFRLLDSGPGTPPRRDTRDRLPPASSSEKRVLSRIAAAAAGQYSPRHQTRFDFLPPLFGKAHHVVSLDALSQTHDLLPLSGEVLVCCACGVSRTWIEERVRGVGRLGAMAAEKLGIKSLRFLDLARLKKLKSRLSPQEFSCAYFAVTEARRVSSAELALRNDDHAVFGQCMSLSHASSRDHLRNSLPGLDRLVEAANSHHACLGARLTGPGFGGPMIALVRHHEADDFVEFMESQVLEDGSPVCPKVIELGEGVH